MPPIYPGGLMPAYAILRGRIHRTSEGHAFSTADVNVAMQHQNHPWGKWRPSEAARLGPKAVLLDRLLSRDGYSLREASEILRTDYHVEMSSQELTDLAAKLPQRNLHRPMEVEEVLQSPLSLDMIPAEFALAQESAEKRRWVWGLLREALAMLSPEDQLIVKLRKEHSVAVIARNLNLEQKPLYRRLEGIYASLRSTLESKGVSAEDMADIHLEHEI